MSPAAAAGALHLAAKFSASLDGAAAMLRQAADAGARAAACFHPGSQCLSEGAWAEGARLAGEAASRAGVRLDAIDVGGGFPAPYPGASMPGLGQIFPSILEARRQVAPKAGLLCEPGRALAAEAMSLIVQVQLRKGDRLCVNDGVHGALSEMRDLGISWPAKLIRPDGPHAKGTRPFLLEGPTCDSIDMLELPFELPEDAREGDWIEIGMAGAYSLAQASAFNGFTPAAVETAG